MEILLVDDNALFLESARRFLANLCPAARLTTARSGAAAVAEAAKTRPDLVLMDFSMPGMNGLEATRLIKQHDCTVRVVVVSLHDAAEFRAAAVGAGAEAFVNKQEFANLVPPLLTLGEPKETGDFCRNAPVAIHGPIGPGKPGLPT